MYLDASSHPSAEIPALAFISTPTLVPFTPGDWIPSEGLQNFAFAIPISHADKPVLKK